MTRERLEGLIDNALHIKRFAYYVGRRCRTAMTSCHFSTKDQNRTKLTVRVRGMADWATLALQGGQADANQSYEPEGTAMHGQSRFSSLAVTICVSIGVPDIAQEYLGWTSACRSIESFCEAGRSSCDSLVSRL